MSSITGQVNTPVMPMSNPSIAYGAGNEVGKHIRNGFGFLSRNSKSIAIVLLMIAITVSILYLTFGTDNCTNITIVEAARHYGCKGKGGCGSDCPYISDDDPRRVMKHKVNAMEETLDFMKTLTANEDKKIVMATEYLQSESKKPALTSTLEAIVAGKAGCVANVSTYTALSRAELTAYGNSDKIDTKVVNSKNRVSGYEAIVNINVNAFTCLTLQMDAVIMATRIGDIDETLKHSIKDFETKSTEVDGSIRKINSSVADIMQTVNGGLDKDIQSVQNSTASEDIIGSMSNLMNLSISMEPDVSAILKLHDSIAEVFQLTFKSGFSNSLPAQLGSEEVSTLIDNDDYNTALIKTALEPEIVKNHLKFATERSSFDSGGGVPSVRDDDNDIVPWVGLFGRPTYRKSDGSSIEQSSEPLRSIPSDIPEDLMRTKTPRISFV
jgi:hypothetical protein